MKKQQRFYHPAFTVLQKEDATTALAKKNALQWNLVKQAIALGSKKSKEKLLSLKSTALAAEVASLKKEDK